MQSQADQLNDFGGTFRHLEVDGQAYKAYLDRHPHKSHLRRGILTCYEMPYHFVYDIKAFNANSRPDKQPSDFQVAARWKKDGSMQYFVVEIT